MDETELPKYVIACAAYGVDGRRRDISLDAISDVLAVDDGSFVWVGLYEPGKQILGKLQEEFGLHDLAVEDAHNAHQRPKLEAYDHSLFIALQTAQSVNGELVFGETQVFLGRRYIVTVRHDASPSYAPARARMEREPDWLRHGPSAALYAVLDLVVDDYQPIVDEFDAALGALEQDVFSEEYRKDTVEKLYDLRREMTRLQLAVSPLQDVVSQLARSRDGVIDGEIQLYLRDVFDHLVRINESVGSVREMLTAAMNVNLALVTVHLALVTVQQGEVVKRLGAWAALLAVPTLVASWYGMNFAHMPELKYLWSYPVLVGIVGVACIVLYRLFRRTGWL